MYYLLKNPIDGTYAIALDSGYNPGSYDYLITQNYMEIANNSDVNILDKLQSSLDRHNINSTSLTGLYSVMGKANTFIIIYSTDYFQYFSQGYHLVDSDNDLNILQSELKGFSFSTVLTNADTTNTTAVNNNTTVYYLMELNGQTVITDSIGYPGYKKQGYIQIDSSNNLDFLNKEVQTKQAAYIQSITPAATAAQIASGQIPSNSVPVIFGIIGLVALIILTE